MTEDTNTQAQMPETADKVALTAEQQPQVTAEQIVNTPKPE